MSQKEIDWAKQSGSEYKVKIRTCILYCLAQSTSFGTPSIFETGANGVPSKPKNPTILGQGGPASTQWSQPSSAGCANRSSVSSFDGTLSLDS